MNNKIKKITLIFALTSIMIGGLSGGQKLQARVLNIPGGDTSHFMRVESRDKNNRPVESAVVFEQTAFSKIYNILSPAGSTRWRRGPLTPVEANLNHVPNFEFPSPAITLFYSPNTSMKEFFRLLSHSGTNSTFFFLGFPLIFITTVLTFKGNLPTLDEPRFRVPVFLE